MVFGGKPVFFRLAGIMVRVHKMTWQQRLSAGANGTQAGTDAIGYVVVIMCFVDFACTRYD